MNLVHLRLRHGEAVAEERVVDGSERAKQSAPFPEKGEAGCALSAQKGEAECALSPPLSPPFSPYPSIPLNPPEKQETFGLRPLLGPQGAVFRVNLLLEEAGVPTPTPAGPEPV